MLKRQMCYLVNVTHHPKYLNMVQHLGWEFAAAPWAVFPKMINIQSIDITMNGAFIGGGRIVPVFPNLRKARLAGIFYPGSLECMLLTSPFLTELHLVDMAGEAGSVRAYDPNARTIVHFVDVCVSTPGKLPHLKILNISRLVTECYRNTTQHPGPEWESWARFILHYAHQLEDLRMELDPCHWRPLGQDANPRSIFGRHVLPILKSGKFVLLKHLNLKGVDLTADDEAQLKRSLPLGAQFIWTSVTALNPNFGRR
ncbi:hypothetical protein FRC02_007202 [Tulasnella sp. 418]|nr:hypothetical protein FRC02_007202 [Tulasnella sp. 418]